MFQYTRVGTRSAPGKRTWGICIRPCSKQSFRVTRHLRWNSGCLPCAYIYSDGRQFTHHSPRERVNKVFRCAISCSEWDRIVTSNARRATQKWSDTKFLKPCLERFQNLLGEQNNRVSVACKLLVHIFVTDVIELANMCISCIVQQNWNINVTQILLEDSLVHFCVQVFWCGQI